MKRFLLFAAALLLIGAASACDKNGGKDNPTPSPVDDGRVHPGTTTLLELFQEKIDEYGKQEVPASRIYICAHRANTWSSADKKIPENSVAAIEEAIAQGADMVELDPRSTSDGAIVLMHDATVNATTNGTGSVANMTLAQIKALRMKYRGQSSTYKKDGQEIQVPTLLEALLACKDKIYVNLDVKDCKINALMKVIQEADMADQVMIYGYSANEKQEIIEWAYNNMSTWIAVHPYIGSPNDCRSYLTMAYCNCALLFQYAGDTYYKGTTEKFGYKVHALGGLSYSNSLTWDSEIRSWYSNYYVNDIEAPCKVLDQFIASGSDFVQTDCFELAELYLKSKGLR